MVLCGYHGAGVAVALRAGSCTVLKSVFFLKDYGVKRSLNLESFVAGKGF